MEDTEISRLISERSESGLAELKRKYERLILKVCRGILKSSEDAEECANDALYAVWESIARENPDDLMAFVCKIARRKALNRLRYNLAPIRNSDLLVELDEISVRSVSADISSDKDSPEEYAERAELTAVLNEWLGTLPEKQRILFMRRYFFSDSVKEAGKACRMNANAAGAALLRLRGQLKKLLTERGFDHEN